jgi:hypothetical protein
VFAAAARPRRPYGKLQVERIEDKLGYAYEALVHKMHRRLLDRVKAKLGGSKTVKAAMDEWPDEWGDDLVEDDEYEDLEALINEALQVTLGLCNNRAKSEGYKTAAVQARLGQGVTAQLGYIENLQTDMRADYEDVTKEAIDEFGPNIFEIGNRLQERLPVTVARSRTIAITETEKVYGWAYGDILKSNGWTYCKWRVSPDELVCKACRAKDNRVMTIEEWWSTFPAHPNCRCWNEGYRGDWTGY